FVNNARHHEQASLVRAQQALGAEKRARADERKAKFEFQTAHFLALQVVSALGELSRVKGRFAEVEGQFKRAKDLFEKLAEGNVDDTDFYDRLAQVYGYDRLAHIYLEGGKFYREHRRPDEAEVMLKLALDWFGRLATDSPEDANYQARQADCHVQ